MNWTRVTAPSIEPVSLEEAKAHLRVDHTAEDALIQALIPAAREYIEEGAGRALMTQTWRVSLDRFCRQEIRLPMPPLQSVTSITYLDEDGVQQTLDPSAYSIDADAEPARVLPAYGESWPAVRSAPGSVKITYVAGYSTPQDVPARAKQAILLLVSHWFEHREAIGTVTREVELAVTALMGQLWHGRLM